MVQFITMSLEHDQQQRILEAAQNNFINALRTTFGFSNPIGDPRFTIDQGIHAFTMVPEELRDAFLNLEMLEIADRYYEPFIDNANPDVQMAHGFMIDQLRNLSGEGLHYLKEELSAKISDNHVYPIPQIIEEAVQELFAQLEFGRPYRRLREFNRHQKDVTSVLTRVR